ncbi:putative metal-binding motif-containing protein [Nitrosopumilus sp. K4]|uniref:MopE-related protein n=1 Tax=Nitrosopumilus sp. K4 TaxID=2795383 RepID=UPI001BAD7C40|nr:MopE-related protein [Nitrosopumilus sp. K4]QUC65539.1 putative metal-binding motif-containing protein [Nitrosopumilus sp. K4]
MTKLSMKLLTALALLSITSMIVTSPMQNAFADADGDGLEPPFDCDDNDPLIGEAVPYFLDEDQDGYGSHIMDFLCPNDPDVIFYSVFSDDCDDSNPDVNPGATEVDDGIDNDCDGIVDEGFEDSDGDGIIDTDEANYGTDPNNYDTDGDGVSDGEEILNLLSDPLDACSPSSDNDVCDSDGDGIPDSTDPCPFDPSNECIVVPPSCEEECTITAVTIFEQCVVNGGDDFTCSQEANAFEDQCILQCSLPTDDSDGDGIPDSTDPCPFDPQNTCVSCNPDGDSAITPDELVSYLDAYGISESDLPYPVEQLIALLELQVDGSNQNGLIDTPSELEAINQGLSDFGIPYCSLDFPDTDGDGIPDSVDECPFDPNNECIEPPTPQVSFVEIETINLNGKLDAQDFKLLVDLTPFQSVTGHIAMKVPCDKNGQTPLVIKATTIDIEIVQLDLVSVEPISVPGKSCVYHGDILPGIVDIILWNDDAKKPVQFSPENAGHTVTITVAGQ